MITTVTRPVARPRPSRKSSRKPRLHNYRGVDRIGPKPSFVRGGYDLEQLDRLQEKDHGRYEREDLTSQFEQLVEDALLSPDFS